MKQKRNKRIQLEQLIKEELNRALLEQEQESSNADLFSPAEQAFLGKFAEYNTNTLGIIYSKNAIGLQEFLGRSGAALNLSLPVLQKLAKDKIISIVPYGGYGRNEDYTLRLNIDLSNVEDFKGKTLDTAPAGEAAPAEPAEETPAEEVPANEWVVNYNDLLSESVRTAKKLIQEAKSKKKSVATINTKASRTLKRLPKGYLFFLEKIVTVLGRKLHTDLERQHLVADILDNLAYNFGLSPQQIHRSYVFYRNQNKLQNIIGTK
jgi:hypothetical protein